MKNIYKKIELRETKNPSTPKGVLTLFIHLVIVLMLLIIPFSSCKKQDKFLDKKRNNADVVPTVLKDYQAILDNNDILNTQYSAFGVLGSDNYYLTDADWLSNDFMQERNSYVWAPDIYGSEKDLTWTLIYQRVMYTNAVLDGLKKVVRNASNKTQYEEIEGQALFFRAYQFYYLVQLWAKPYNTNTATTDLAIPIRMTADVNSISIRNSNQQVYDQIISDLKKSIQLLPLTQNQKTRPSKTAANTLLARVYLSMGNYADAWQYSDIALQQQSSLLNFATYTPVNSPFTFQTYQGSNPEIIFYSETGLSLYNFPGYYNVDSNLYNSYATSDLRKSLFYADVSGKNTFIGSYTGDYPFFSGLATNELFLIRAEANARLNRAVEAMSDLNYLLAKRWDNSFAPFSASTSDEALFIILRERRKEIPFTGQLRWEDLRRLNIDFRFADTLKRLTNGQIYLLPPNDNRYVYPIPEEEIRLSGLQQNPR